MNRARRIGRIGRVAASLLGAGLLVAGPGPGATAQSQGPDPAEVVLVFDFSASILDDAATRNRFADALDRIADRVNETEQDLIAGDTTVSLVQFASRAADVPGCTNLKLLDSPATVDQFETCLRNVASGYRTGINAATTDRIGIDTNYVAALEQAAANLPAGAARPSVVFFSDGRHDVRGVSGAEVLPARDRLFGARRPFALLPVGLGLDPAARPQLEAGLQALLTLNGMPACATGSLLEWPQVAFDNPDDAGTAVGVALQNATCTFTVEATPAPTQPPQAPISSVLNIRLTPLDGQIEVHWSAPPGLDEPPTDYKVRCVADGEDPVESTEGVSTERSTVVEGLTNGTAYTCEVATISGGTEGEWTPADELATPSDVPQPPAKPAVEALDGALRVSVVPPESAPVSAYHYECSADNGATWPAFADITGQGDTAAQISGLANGTAYVCRAFAANNSGTSEASPLSDAIAPCSTALDCAGLTLPVMGAIAGALAIAVLLAFFVLLRGRSGGYTLAIVDVVHTANLGGGSSLGLSFVGAPRARQLDGIAAAKGRKADVRIKKLRGDRFRVEDKHGTHEVESGEPVVVSDASGVRHELVLRAFAGKAASAVARR
jgi:hypothetical protein